MCFFNQSINQSLIYPVVSVSGFLPTSRFALLHDSQHPLEKGFKLATVPLLEKSLKRVSIYSGRESQGICTIRKDGWMDGHDVCLESTIMIIVIITVTIPTSCFS